VWPQFQDYLNDLTKQLIRDFSSKRSGLL